MQGAGGSSACRPCPGGTSGPVPGLAECPVCAGGTREAVACPVGTYQPELNKGSPEDCLECPAGTECGAGSSSATQCKPGFANEYPGGAQGACKRCPAGSFCPRSDDSGYYDTITPCAAGTYNTLEGQTKENA